METNNCIKTNIYAFLQGGIGCCLSASAIAQTPPDAGSILRDQQKPALELPKPAPGLKIDEPARPALARSSVTRFALKSVRFSGNTVFGAAELQAVIQDALGKDVDFAALDGLAARLSRYYRERGYLVARAYLPAQEIKDGAVEFAVIEGRVGKVNLNNKSRVRDSIISGYTSGLPGSVVNERNLERPILLLNDLAGVGEARAGLSPGANVGESDLTINLTEAPLLRGSLEYDNQGNRYTGANRLTGRLNVLSPLGLGDALNLLYTHGFDGLDYGRVGYQIPLGGDGLKLGAAYSNVHYKLGKDFAPLDRNGTSDSYTLSVSYPFIRSANVNLYGQAAYEWRDFEDREGAVRTQTDKTTRGATLTLSGDARDSLLGGGVSVFSLAYNGGRLNIDTPAARAIDDATARSNGHYDKWNLNLLRLQTIAGPLSAYFAFSGQKANKNLDSSEKFTLGGANGVRAYPQGEASGDSGYVATAELRYTAAFQGVPGMVQPFVFVDAGSVKVNENPFGTAPNKRNLAGAGIGVTWSKSNDFTVRLSIATRIGNQVSNASDTDRHMRGWVQIAKYF